MRLVRLTFLLALFASVALLAVSASPSPPVERRDREGDGGNEEHDNKAADKYSDSGETVQWGGGGGGGGRRGYWKWCYNRYNRYWYRRWCNWWDRYCYCDGGYGGGGGGGYSYGGGGYHTKDNEHNGHDNEKRAIVDTPDDDTDLALDKRQGGGGGNWGGGRRKYCYCPWWSNNCCCRCSGNYCWNTWSGRTAAEGDEVQARDVGEVDAPPDEA